MANLIIDPRDQKFAATARYFIKHVLPEVDAAAKAIKSGDLSMMEIADEGFAS
ncbi:MAG: acyl-CoA dehydrogenase C-terminal domain-containing protein [Proteobacteria bacterium]|nr:acyl-CoA dehydrogenase C-terminal domain-containing protein [Pseudomonadota bacterium]MCG2739569.1 acyl-CoA dehydrogenase C-terminal domain-containing protein [Syntrophaceae bacterium]MBU1743627.1 acyl-CoA dehydrogenase C-terminal domain-containing protein [Pseudomonadota bacterium]MBU1965124.1 acyl-CoA dehydrogenase C-terminal domain-containing protein [Pseudomonadota bacterium]MBU4371008.1 acyl-CoA dehydrogenase C-terminal domain-containing protein [Pseudomonadota bacterium]